MFQNEVLNRIVEKYREKKLAHAYLIETNNIDRATSDLKELVKVLNCEQNFTSNCNNCNLCNLINKNNLPSLKIIEPDGTSIKKNQIESLKIDFDSIPIYSKYNVYIIKNAEKLNVSSANAMLKFLEEPTDGILGFFITNNKDIMIETIKSRCQSLVLNYESNKIEDILNVTSEEYEKYKQIAKNYLEKIEASLVINNKQEILSVFTDRTEVETLFKLIFNIYYENMLKIIGQEYNSELIEIYEVKDKFSKINQKLQIITKILTNMSYNVSVELILDKFVIEMRGTNE